MSKKLAVKILILFVYILLLSIPKAFAPCYPPPNNSFCEGNFDHDCDVDGTDASVFKSDFGRSTYSNACPPSGPAMVPRTGQVSSWFPYDNGYTQCGIAWPNARFTNNGNGTVTDNLTGLTWVRDLRCLEAGPPDKTCPELMSHCYWLEVGQCNLSDGSEPGDWRLPTINELLSLVDYGQYDPMLYPDMFTNWTGHVGEEYCSSTVFAHDKDYHYTLNLRTADTSLRIGADMFEAICVRKTHPYCPEAVTTVPTTSTSSIPTSTSTSTIIISCPDEMCSANPDMCCCTNQTGSYCACEPIDVCRQRTPPGVYDCIESCGSVTTVPSTSTSTISNTTTTIITCLIDFNCYAPDMCCCTNLSGTYCKCESAFGCPMLDLPEPPYYCMDSCF